MKHVLVFVQGLCVRKIKAMIHYWREQTHEAKTRQHDNEWVQRIWELSERKTGSCKMFDKLFSPQGSAGITHLQDKLAFVFFLHWFGELLPDLFEERPIYLPNSTKT